MINEKDILAMLQEGKKPDDIAQMLVDTLNKAQDMYAEEQEKAKLEAEANVKYQNKVKDMQDILDLVHDFILEYYCETNEDIDQLAEVMDNVKAEDVIQQIEEIGKLAVELNKSLDGINAMLTNKKPVSFDFVIDTKEDADSIINSFLNSMGLGKKGLH